MKTEKESRFVTVIMTAILALGSGLIKVLQVFFAGCMLSILVVGPVWLITGWEISQDDTFRIFFVAMALIYLGEMVYRRKEGWKAILISLFLMWDPGDADY